MPENTVDAWTAIKLSRVRAPWIWLPTTNQGAAWSGSHPGDVSAILGRRLVLIENKGVEDGVSIDFGTKAVQQLDYLREVEEAGLVTMSAPDPRSLGWVFYGLPDVAGFVDGTAWKDFPRRQYLPCPHSIDLSLGPPRAFPLTAVRRLHRQTTVHYVGSQPFILSVPPQGPFWSMRLEGLNTCCRRGVAGLPLSATARGLLAQVRGLVRTAAEAADRDVEVGDDIFALLHTLAAVVSLQADNPVLGVLG